MEDFNVFAVYLNQVQLLLYEVPEISPPPPFFELPKWLCLTGWVEE